MKVFVLEKPSIRKSDAMDIGCGYKAHWLLTLCVLLEDALHIDFDAVRNSCCDCVHCLLIDATNIDSYDEY